MSRWLAECIRDVAAERGSSRVPRAEVKEEWLRRHPQHDRPTARVVHDARRRDSGGGYARVVIQRALLTLERAGVVQREGRDWIWVLDHARLAALADGDAYVARVRGAEEDDTYEVRGYPGSAGGAGVEVG